MEMSVPMTAVIRQEVVSMQTIPLPVMTEMCVPELILVQKEAAWVVILLPVMMETAVPMTPVIQ
jgi:hypothetical protein